MSGSVVDSSISQGSHYAVGNYYITYTTPAVNQGSQTIQPECVWYVQISSSSTGSYSGKVSNEPQGDAYYNGGAGYTPSCTSANLSVNGTTGNWSVSLDWAK